MSLCCRCGQKEAIKNNLIALEGSVYTLNKETKETTENTAIGSSTVTLCCDCQHKLWEFLEG